MVLHEAALQRSASVVKILLTARAALNAACKGTARTALHWAAISGDAEIIELLLNAKANLHAVDEQGSTALHLAASDHVTKVLLDAGLDMDKVDSLGTTALYRAAKRGRKDVCAMLVHARADLNITDKATGWSQLHRAARNGDSSVLLQLLLARAEVNLPTFDNEGVTALHLAASEDVARELLGAHAHVNMTSSRGDTPLHCARSTGIVTVLIQARANPCVKDICGETVFHRFHGQKVLTKCLLSVRADVESAGPSYCAHALRFAIQEHDADLAKLLLEAGVNLKCASSRDPGLMTSLTSLAHNKEELGELLIGAGQADLKSPRLGRSSFKAVGLSIIDRSQARLI